MDYVKTEVFSLKEHPKYNEKWVQGKIAEDPSILGLGDLILRDAERPQPSGGRLDLLLQDPVTNRRYEVEIQLGKNDESHIIRAIEYWEIERKRFPQYEHCAVIIAEDITSRFLNVLSIFNGFIPIIVIQMKAIKVGDNISLFFTTVMNEFSLGTEDDEAERQPTDRKFWENTGSKESLMITDKLLEYVNQVAPGYNLKYNKYYIGLSKDGISNNFVSFIPKKSSVIFQIKYEQLDEIQEILNSTDFDVMAYDRQWKQYRIRLTESDIEKNADVLKLVIEKAFIRYMK